MNINIKSQYLLLGAIVAVMCNLVDNSREAFADTNGEWDEDVAKQRITFYLTAILVDDQEFELHQEWYMDAYKVPYCSDITIEQFSSEVSKEDFIKTASLLKDCEYLDCIEQAHSYIRGAE